MNNYLLLVACFLLGILLRRSGRLPDNAAAVLNGFIVHISLPALTLTYVHGLKLQTSLILPAMMPWLMFGIGCGFFWLAGRAFGFSRQTIGGLMLTGGLANTSFIGLPMIEAFYGPQWNESVTNKLLLPTEALPSEARHETRAGVVLSNSGCRFRTHHALS